MPLNAKEIDQSLEKSLHLYLAELDFQCVRCMIAMQQYSKLVDTLQAAANDRSRRPENLGADLIDCVHRFFTHAALISKMLWPIRGSELALQRGNQLRAILQVGDDSLLKKRTLRDAIEHFDERLDKWVVGNNVNDNLVNNVICDRFDRLGPGINRESMFRVLNVHTHQYIFMGELYEISDLLSELVTFQRIVESYTRQKVGACRS